MIVLTIAAGIRYRCIPHLVNIFLFYSPTWAHILLCSFCHGFFPLCCDGIQYYTSLFCLVLMLVRVVPHLWPVWYRFYYVHLTASTCSTLWIIIRFINPLWAVLASYPTTDVFSSTVYRSFGKSFASDIFHGKRKMTFFSVRGMFFISVLRWKSCAVCSA